MVQFSAISIVYRRYTKLPFNEFEFANHKSKSYLSTMGCVGWNNITKGLFNSSHKFMKEEDDIKCQKICIFYSIKAF